MFLASDFIFNLIRFPIHSKIFSAEKALPKRGKKFSLPSTNVLSYVTRKLKLVEFFFLIHLSGTKFRVRFRWKHEYQLCNFRYEYLRQKLFRQEKMWFVFKHGNLMRFFFWKDSTGCARDRKPMFPSREQQQISIFYMLSIWFSEKILFRNSFLWGELMKI